MLDEYSAIVKRDLDSRRFNLGNVNACRTGGMQLGCPFLERNKNEEMTCLLYREELKRLQNNLCERSPSCLADKDVPTKKVYSIGKLATVFAMSPEEALSIYHRHWTDIRDIGDVTEEGIVSHEIRL